MPPRNMLYFKKNKSFGVREDKKSSSHNSRAIMVNPLPFSSLMAVEILEHWKKKR